MQISYLKVVIIGFLLVLASSFTVEPHTIKTNINTAQLNSRNIGFNNQSGPNTTAAQVSAFINFINSGSSFYRNDNILKLRYVSSQMNSSFGASRQGFSVISAGNQTNIDWAISTFSGVYGSIAAGADLLFPSKSYMFVREAFSNGQVSIFTFGQRGFGIDSIFESAIDTIIFSFETESSCICQHSEKIRDGLNKLNQGAWNIFCSSSESLQGVVFQFGRKYMYVKPKNCYYLIYQNA